MLLQNKHEDIEGLRIIRDPSTLVGKGIGYLLFRDRDCVLKALALHKVWLLYSTAYTVVHAYLSIRYYVYHSMYS